MKKKNLSVKKIIHNKVLSKLSDKKILKTYKYFEKKFLKLNLKEKTIAAAISGGPDSNALAFLIKCISIKNNIKVRYYHIDHGLRNSSSAEAKLLKKKLGKFDIKIDIMKWNRKKPIKNIQSDSRKIRYQLIFKKMKQDNIKSVFFGHTEDDLIENFFLRLTRGSGTDGLVSFNNLISKFNNLSVIRLLLDSSKDELIYISNKVFNFYIEDISNANESFKRVRFRSIIKKIKSEGLDIKKLNKTIKNLDLSNRAIRFYTDENIIQNTNFLSNNRKVIISKNFFIKPEEIIFRSLSQILKRIGGKYYPPRGKKLSNLINLIQNKGFKRTTLARCIIEKLDNSLVIYGEYQKKA